MNRLIAGLTFLIASATPSFAQYKNIRIDEGVNATAAGVAVNPRNTKNAVVVSSKDQVLYTLDGGITWQKSKLGSIWGVFGNASVVVDDKGTFYSFYLSDESGEGLANDKCLERVVCQASKDGGITWDEAISVSLITAKDQFKIGACVDGKGNVYVAWTQFDKYKGTDENCASVIYFSQSSNGKKWSQPVPLSQTSGGCLDDDQTVMGAIPAVEVDGKLLFTMWAHQKKIFLDRSFNSGSTWLRNDIFVGDQPGGWRFKIPGHDQGNGLFSLAIDRSKSNKQGSLYMVWADQRNGVNDTDVWFSRSTNLGDNWTGAARVNDNGTGNHQYFPAMTLDQSTGYLYVVYYDRRNYDDNQTDVYLAYSTDAGNTFKNIKISESPFTPQESVPFGDHISISVNKGVIVPVWTRVDNEKTSIWTAVINHADLAKAP